MLASYAVASGVYRWVVTFAILTLLFFFLKPYRLEALAGLLAGLTVLALILTPLVRVVRAWHSYGRVPPMSGRRVVVSSGLLAALRWLSSCCRCRWPGFARLRCSS